MIWLVLPFPVEAGTEGDVLARQTPTVRWYANLIVRPRNVGGR